jgi:hypothetical protein
MSRRHVAVALMVLGVILAIPAIVVGVVRTRGDLRIQAAQTTPAVIDVDLAAGRWEVFEWTGTTKRAGAGPLSFSYSSVRPLDIDAGDVRVDDSLGQAVPVRSAFSSSSFQTYITGSRIYTGVATFSAVSAGTYAIEVLSPTTDQVIVAHPPLEGLRRSVGLILAAIAGVVLLVVGFVLMILDVDSRRKAKRGPGPGSGQWGGGQWGPPSGWGPPGWGPPPQPPSGLR